MTSPYPRPSKQILTFFWYFLILKLFVNFDSCYLRRCIASFLPRSYICYSLLVNCIVWAHGEQYQQSLGFFSHGAGPELPFSFHFFIRHFIIKSSFLKIFTTDNSFSNRQRSWSTIFRFSPEKEKIRLGKRKR